MATELGSGEEPELVPDVAKEESGSDAQLESVLVLVKALASVLESVPLFLV